MLQSVIMPLTPNSIVQAIDYEAVTIGAVATGLTPSKVALAWRVVIRLDDGSEIRFRTDGPAPTASVGFPAFQLDQIELEHQEAVNFLAIRTSAPDMTAHVIYYGRPT